MQDLDEILIELGMHPDCVVLDDCARQFADAMAEGLKGNRTGMQMLPTYISAEGQVPRNEKIIVMDAGGTNFRRAVAWFNDDGELVLDQFEIYPMPGTWGEMRLNAFFDQIADYIMPIIKESDKICFCFSYATDALPNRDGRLQRFCKEVQVRDSEGIEVCAELKKALRRNGVMEEKDCVLINDSVAALLGGKAVAGEQDYDSWVGYIYGTGLNACYVEKNANIAEVGGDGEMIVNMEAGMHIGFPMGEADRLLDEDSELPGDHMFEKMVAGGYLGRVMALTALLLSERGLFSHDAAHALRRVEAFTLADIGEFLDGGEFQNGEDDPIAGMDEQDREILLTLCDRLYERAAKLVVLSIGAVLTHIGKEKMVCCTMEGTTFRKSRKFREHFFRLGQEYLQEQLGVCPVFLECEDTTLTGTAIAGLLN